GDVITEIGQQAVTQVSDVEERLEAAKEAGRKSLLLLVRRGDQPRFVALTIE
ncbi:MAG: serine protease, partial [Pseudomonadota bacterium]